MRRVSVRSAAAFLATVVLVCSTLAAAEPLTVEAERSAGVTRIWAGPHLLRTTEADVSTVESGADPTGRALFARWNEGGEAWSSYSRDAGATWTESRRLRTALRLHDGDVAEGLELPSAGRLFLVQFRTVGLPEWRASLSDLGIEVLNHVPHNAHIVRVDPGLLSTVRSLDFVERVEPYHPSYRLLPELRDDIVAGGADGSLRERVRVMTFGWGPEAKQHVIDAAESLGAEVAEYWPSGKVVELWATHAQIQALAAHDDVLWIDRWSAPEPDMDLVRQDAGTDFVESRFGYCGEGVRGEVMDGGVQDDHPDFDGIVLHGPFTVGSHGTSTYGIVFGNGDRDGDGDGQGPGHLACGLAQGIFADYDEVADRYAHTQELKGDPYFASFQTNSWGSSLTTIYNSYSEEMDDIIWRLDIAITQSQSNEGNRNSRPQAWAKNVISVGGIRHYDTLDTSDDAWAYGASIGPAQDGRIKPDVSYWYDDIFTTTTGSSYTTGFGGTSAATPETAGVLGLILEMWADNVWETDPVGATVFEKQPHFSTLKALLINNAQQYDFTGESHDLTRVHQGWGRPSARVAFERASTSLVVDEEEILSLGESVVYDVVVSPGETELKVTMVYPDPPGTSSSSVHRINDVNLSVTSPSATTYHGNAGLEEGTESTAGGSPDSLNTVENVFLRNPQAGTWQVEIEAVEINQDAHLDTPGDDVTFALVVTGASAPYTDGAGDVRFLRAPGSCGSTREIRVRDGNAGTSSVTVEVRSETETTPETVTLQETVSGSGIYTGQVDTADTTPTPGDGIVSAGHGDTLTVEYLDADDGQGGSDLLRQDTATVDCAGPVISQVDSSAVTEDGATITWTTDEVSSSTVNWGDTAPPTETKSRAAATTSHAVRLDDLAECTEYVYSVGSEDAAGNPSTDDNSGVYYTFTTLMNTGGEIHSCRAGRVTLSPSVVHCNDTVSVRLTDTDLNLDPGLVDTAVVYVTSSTETTPETLVLTETGPDTAEFAGTIATAEGSAVPGDGILQSSDGDLVTGRYEDEDDGSGSPATHFDTISTDCAGAGIPSVAVTDITDDSAIVRWSTTEPTTGDVEWGLTPALGSVASSVSLKTDHNVTIAPFAPCDRVFFRIVTADAHGSISVAQGDGGPYEFNGATMPGTIFRDEFETDGGWTLPGEWEIDAPAGLGSSPSDPLVAYAGLQVLGHDPTGLGSYPGDYEPGASESAVSPPIDASGLSSASLLFQRWLNVANGGRAYLDVKDSSGTWHQIYATPSFGGLQESWWNSVEYDVSAYADGNPDFQIRFRQSSISGTDHDAGWNVDRLILRDGSLPDFEACGGCGGGPSFGGITSAVDDDPCADSTVTLRWSPAPAWGTGNGGTYAVYRDTQAGFTPGPGNRVASGIPSVTWTDTTAPADTTLHYLVRAENDETCSTGPANGGILDENLVYAEVRNETSQPWPGPVGDTLTVNGVNQAHALLEWSPAADAAAYRVYRSDDPAGNFGLEHETSETLHEDADAYGDPRTLYYLTRAVDACGNEAP